MIDKVQSVNTFKSRTPPPLFSLGFRPFYLLAGAIAMISVPLWIAQYWGVMTLHGYLSGPLWHAHEMVFGFAAAVITGFLFTAVRNWTGLPTPSGWRLASLAALWLAARVALVTGPPPLAIGLDVAFLPAVALSLWLPLRQSRNRNLFFVALLLVLAAANGMFHLSHLGVLSMPASAPIRFALYLVIVIVAIMGGRVIPGFTANAIRHARVRPSSRVDRWSIIAIGLAFGLVLTKAPAGLSGTVCAFAALLHAARLSSWDPLSTRADPIVWILHLSYAWIPIGLALHAAALWGLGVNAVLADHALGTGAVGGIVLGMMTRTARGHTGRPLRAGRRETAAYALVHAAAVVRVLLVLALPAAYGTLVGVAALLWAMAFGLFLWVFTPMLVRERADGRPG